jgi:hypothetical protein
MNNVYGPARPPELLDFWQKYMFIRACFSAQCTSRDTKATPTECNKVVWSLSMIIVQVYIWLYVNRHSVISFILGQSGWL